MAVKKAAPKTSAKELAPKHYRLLNYEPLTFTLKVGRDNQLLIFDENKRVNRAIRHCPNEKSIYVDEQSSVAVVEPIIFLKGTLATGPRDVITQDFLAAHPKNGSVFAIVDDAADAQQLADMEEVKMDVKAAIRAKSKEDAGIEELRLITSVLISDIDAAAKMSVPELKTELYGLVDANIFRFVDEDGDVTVFDDVEIKRQAIAQHAFKSGVIQVSADASKVMWRDNKATICHIPVGQDSKEYFAQFLGTEEGLQVAVEISKRG